MNKSMKHIITAVLSITAAAYCIPVRSQSVNAPASRERASSQVQEQADLSPQTEGEVRKVDPETGKVTIKHGEIKNLDMPGMTMVFQAMPKGLAAGLKPGDKVLFRAETVSGIYAMTAVKPAE